VWAATGGGALLLVGAVAVGLRPARRG
jgi:hypothetical protein